VRFLPFLALLPIGCVEYDLQRFDGTDVFYQKPADLVDILLVVDNSCSMAPYQTKLASNFQSFIQFFVDVDVDYHIGVTTTTVSTGSYPGRVLRGSTSEFHHDFVRSYTSAPLSPVGKR